MDQVCHGCGEPGHYRAQCTSPSAGKAPRPAPALTGARRKQDSPVPPPVPPRRPPAEIAEPAPLAEAIREVMGWPGSGGSALGTHCPWCKASPWTPCSNPGTGKRTGLHQARRDAAAARDKDAATKGTGP